MHSTKTKLFSFILTVPFLFASCTSSETGNNEETQYLDVPLVSKYELENEMQSFLNQEFNISMPDTMIYIPLSTCETCVHETFEMLEKNRYNNLVILGGDTSLFSQYNDAIRWVEENANVRYDKDFEANRYNLEIFGVTMIFKTGIKAYHYSNITWENIDDFKKYVHWK